MCNEHQIRLWEQKADQIANCLRMCERKVMGRLAQDRKLKFMSSWPTKFYAIDRKLSTKVCILEMFNSHEQLDACISGRKDSSGRILKSLFERNHLQRETQVERYVGQP
mmetsp:Transcript_1964/g.3575  ORF Transcript_1964/g.3575 Transcript_1964/m.3575 type:complete len:109 (-) Transcript_1964:1216-1542(-)